MDNTLLMILITCFYIVVLLIIIFVDLRKRRILNVVALPTTVSSLLIGLVLGQDYFFHALLGALAGFLFFFGLYWLGRQLFGPGALGFGDVKLAMLLGGMLGLQFVLHTLALGLFLVGLTGLLLLLVGCAGRRSTIPYGPFLASAGIFMLVWTSI